MRTSKFLSPVTNLFHRLFTVRLGLEELQAKMIAAFLTIVFVFGLGLAMHYCRWHSLVYLWVVICIIASIRFVFRYWWPVIWQETSNSTKIVLNKVTKNHNRELDTADKWPFLCTNCRHPKMYYEKLSDVGRLSSSKPICTKCGVSSDAVRVIILPQNFDQNFGTETYFGPMSDAQPPDEPKK